jgi:hypothetical protein
MFSLKFLDEVQYDSLQKQSRVEREPYTDNPNYSPLYLHESPPNSLI